MSDYFRRYYEAPDDSGAAVEDAPAPDAPDVATEAPETPAAEPITFTPELLAEHLPQFQERFLAHHDPAEALRLYGERDRNVQAALTRYTQGAPTDADVETLRESGYEIPEAEEAAPEPIWGAPWVDPDNYDDIVALVQRDPAKGMALIDKQPERFDPDFRQQVLAYWASPEGGNNPAAMVAYEREQSRLAAIAEAKTYADERYAELEQRLTPLQQGAAEANHQAVSAKIDLLVERAAAEIPEFNEYQDGVKAIVERYAEAYGIDYFTRLVNLPPDQQIAHVREVVGAAMMAGRPAAMAEAEAERVAQEAAKAGAAGQRGRGANGSSNDAMTQAKREHLEAFQRLDGIEVR